MAWSRGRQLHFPWLCSHAGSACRSQTTATKSQSLINACGQTRGAPEQWWCFNPGTLNLAARTPHCSPKIGTGGQSCHIKLFSIVGFFGENPDSQPWPRDGLWHVLAQGRNSFIKSNAVRGLFLSCLNPISALGEAPRG